MTVTAVYDRIDTQLVRVVGDWIMNENSKIAQNYVERKKTCVPYCNSCLSYNLHRQHKYK